VKYTKTTHQLDGDFLIMDVYRYENGEGRVEVVYQPDGELVDEAARSDDGRAQLGDLVGALGAGYRKMIMLQQRTSVELAVAAIARDFATFAARALATLPSIGMLVESYDDDNDEIVEESPA
jgi:hypothetical protein